MKITIITSPFGHIPPYGYGAVERIWFNVAEEMALDGHQVAFISKKKGEINTEVKDSGVSIKYLSGYSWTGSQKKDIILDFIYSFRALFMLTKTDILILNTFWSPLLCFLFKHKYKKTMYNIARFPKGQFRFFKHIDRLSCVSTSVYNELIKQTPSVKNIAKVISNPVNTKVFTLTKQMDSDNFRIVYTGRVHPEKGLLILVEACSSLFEKYPNIELAIVGPRSISNGGGGDSYIEELNRRASKCPIIWIDPISDPHLLKNEIAKGSIFCYPSIASKGETFGVSPLEAMAAGRATVVSNLACFKDFVIDHENGLIFNPFKGNPVKELYDKIELLINNSELRNKLAINGAKTALNFSNKKIADKYILDFSELLEINPNA